MSYFQNIQNVHDILNNIFSAGIIFGLVFSFSIVRNVFLEKRIEKGLIGGGVGIHHDPTTNESFFHLQIENVSGCNLRIRMVVFLGSWPQPFVEAQFETTSGFHQTAIHNYILNKGVKSLNLINSSYSEDGILGSVTLPPMSGGWWKIEKHYLQRPDWKVHDVKLIYQYPTIFGFNRLVVASVTKQSLQLIQQNLPIVIAAVTQGGYMKTD